MFTYHLFTKGRMVNGVNNKIECNDQASGLQAEGFLIVGCRIMLRANLFTEEGLVNGARRTVKDIVYG